MSIHDIAQYRPINGRCLICDKVTRSRSPWGFCYTHPFSDPELMSEICEKCAEKLAEKLKIQDSQ